MFDEQPDGDPHGECAAEIRRLESVAEQQAAVIEQMREDAFKAGFEFCENLTSTEVLNKVKADARREGMLAAAEICDDTDQEYEPVTGEPRRLNYSCGKAIREAAK